MRGAGACGQAILYVVEQDNCHTNDQLNGRCVRPDRLLEALMCCSGQALIDLQNADGLLRYVTAAGDQCTSQNTLSERPLEAHVRGRGPSGQPLQQAKQVRHLRSGNHGRRQHPAAAPDHPTKSRGCQAASAHLRQVGSARGVG